MAVKRITFSFQYITACVWGEGGGYSVEASHQSYNLASCILFWSLYFRMIFKSFYGNVVDWQCCISFREAAKSISYMYKYNHSFFPYSYWVDFPVLESRSILLNSVLGDRASAYSPMPTLPLSWLHIKNWPLIPWQLSCPGICSGTQQVSFLFIAKCDIEQLA